MRKAPRVVRGAETEVIDSDQAVHTPRRVPVPMVQVMMDLEEWPHIASPAWKPDPKAIMPDGNLIGNKLAHVAAQVN
jgi:hypothetical protein